MSTNKLMRRRATQSVLLGSLLSLLFAAPVLAVSVLPTRQASTR